jgi:CcmD family protein
MKTLYALVIALVLAAPVSAQQPARQDEFVPVNAPTNPQETIPAQTLVGIAYGFIWVLLFGYVWSVHSRLNRVGHEMEAVSRRVGAGKQ